ncbi:MAG: biotin transporter BioY, partial [Armatimonadota bacterium]|nr:biotin transporter BioY [Armatimonadota bacterium]
VGNMVIYIFGLPWLACFVGMERVMVAGLLPFIPGDLAKIVLATAMLPWGWKLLKRAGVDMPT